MANGFLQLLSPTPAKGATQPPKQVLALVLRHDDMLMFAEEAQYGLNPFLYVVESVDDLPPTMGSEAVMAWARNAALSLGIDDDDTLSVTIQPRQSLRPWTNSAITLALLDVDPDTFSRLRHGRPVVSANHVLQHVSENHVFGMIAASYMPSRHAG